MNKWWKKFDRLSTNCYLELAQGSTNESTWDEAFGALLEAIEHERSRNADFGSELLELEEEIDYQCDVSGWLEDYLGDLDMREDYEKLRMTCEKVISLFRWEEDSPSDFRFLIASSLGNQEKHEEALAYCEDWYRSQPENMYAGAALVYARMGVKDMAGAEEVVKKFIPVGTVCSPVNDVMFVAASALYKVNGDKKASRRIEKALQKYDEELKEYFFGDDDIDDLEFVGDDDNLPFL